MVVYHPGDESVGKLIAEVVGDDFYVHEGLEIDNYWEDWFILQDISLRHLDGGTIKRYQLAWSLSKLATKRIVQFRN